MFENKEREANYKYIGVDLSEEYLAISQARIEFAEKYEGTFWSTQYIM